MNIAIVGCGLIGNKRALAIAQDDKIVACCDSDKRIADQFADRLLCKPYGDYRTLLSEEDCESVVVAVVNKYAKDIVVEALMRGKNVLAEKPLGRNAEESQIMIEHAFGQSTLGTHGSGIDTAGSENLERLPILKTGFNHRFHPAVLEAKERIERGDIGKVLTIRGRYGHGGRPGMEKEWRASKELCGGGELLDQGVHLVDLIRWFGGEVLSVYGKVETKFWDMEVEDSANVILTTKENVTASFSVSWHNWKNLFSFEIFGSDGYLRIDGLGGSYGPETLECGKRKREGGKPDVQVKTFPPEDTSWIEEWKEFKSAVREGREPIGSGIDGLRANEVIQAIYESSATRRELTMS